jgi:carboxylate-amine ligase
MSAAPIPKPIEVPTLGVELEYQIVDPATRDLSSETAAILEEGAALHGDHIRPEFHAAVVECVTGVCSSVKEISEQVAELRRTVLGLARKRNLKIIAASTHPITHWSNVRLTPGERYLQIAQSLGDLARSNLIYGMHCHLAVEDPEARLAVMSAARNFVPHLLALSCSSPFWQGRDTGLASTRTGVFRRFPRTGVPDHFTSYSEFESYVRTLVETGSITDAKSIYWDIRPHPHFPTVEFRNCDVPTRLRETSAIVALIHLLGTRMVNLYHRGLGYRLYRRALINENIYRAMQQGINGTFIDLPTRHVVPTRDAIRMLLDGLSEEVRFLELDTEVGYIHEILDHGTSSDRQRAVHAAAGNMNAVVDHLIAETEEEL